eukprot:1196255-Prorocentrum_minimum.AAC.2
MSLQAKPDPPAVRSRTDSYDEALELLVTADATTESSRLFSRLPGGGDDSVDVKAKKKLSMGVAGSAGAPSVPGSGRDLRGVAFR